jgi:penicillin amidase
MSRKVRGLVLAGSIVVGLVVVLLGAWLWITHRPFPQTRGRVTLEGIHAPVEIIRDRYGVPHIYAQGSDDLFFAQGFVHAQDRFWQMEFWRRIGAGRLSELFGKTTLETDAFMRTLGFHRIAQQEFDLLPPEEKRVLESYAAGVNAYILHRRPGRLGLEFALLRLQGVTFDIEPWTPADSIAWGKVMAFNLGGNYDGEQLHLDLLRTVGTGIWQALLPRYRADMPYTVDSLELQRMLGPALGGGQGRGSNNWVVAGSRTASGKPLLANDMHLGIQMPSIWYEVGMHGLRPDGTAGRTDACPYTMRGYSFPGVPGVIAGNNDRIAWGMTNLSTDTQDLYIEKLNPANPDQYEVNGRWVDMEIRTETIKVRKADEPTVLRVRSTRHGPVVSDLPSLAELAGYTLSTGKVFPEGVGFTAAALRWTALKPTRLMQAVLGLDRASNFKDFRAALRSWDVAAQNVVYADVDGNIGYQSTGLQPIRARGRGVGPVPGWTNEYEWKGFIPFDKMPYLYNPEKGYIVTANAPIVVPSYPYDFGSDFAFGERAFRIRQLIDSRGTGLTVQDMTTIQKDVYDMHASEMVPYLRGLDLAASPKPWDVPDATESAKERAKREKAEKEERTAMNAARDRLLSWDFQMRATSAEAALYEFFWTALVEETFRDQYPSNLWPPGPGGRLENALYGLLKDPRNEWWDDLRTPAQREGRDDILARAFRQGYRAAVKRMGKTMDKWEWGKVHTAEFRNQSLGESGIKPIEAIFNRGPVPVGGSSTTVSVTVWDADKPFEVAHISSERLVVDLGNLGNSISVHPTGQSGHPFNRHYNDFIEAWRTYSYHPVLWERSQVLADSRERLRLQPKGGR